MYKKLMTFCLTACLGVTNPTGLFADTLVDIVRETISTNPDVQIARDQRNAVEQQMEQTRAGFFPSAEITAGGGWESSDNPATRATGRGRDTLNRRESGILVRQLLFDGFLTENEFDRQKARVNASAYSTFGTSEITALRAIQAYLDVLMERQLVNLAEVNLRTHGETYNKIMKRSESGVGRKSDVEQSMGRRAQAKTNLITEENNLHDSIVAFENVVGREPNQLEEPMSFDYLLPASVDEAITQALDNHPTLKSSEADVEAAREQQQAAKSLFFPRIHLEASGTRSDNLDGVPGSNKDAQLMLVGRYSLTGGKDMARREETAYLLSEAKETRNRTRRQVIESIQLSWNAYERAKTSLESLKVHVDASTESRDAYRKQFDIGQRSLLDLLDSDNELFLAQIDYVKGKNDLMFSIYRILAGMGKLMWALQVPVPQEATTIQ